MRLYRYLIHTCMIERLVLTRGEAGEDIETWQEHNSFSCRLLEGSQSIADTTLGKPVQYDYRLALDPKDVGHAGSGTSILLTDRVKYVTLETGNVLSGPFDVEEIVTKRRKKSELVMVSLRKVTKIDLIIT